MSDRLPDEQVAALRRLTLEQTIAYWDALEAKGRAEGKLNQVVRLLVLSDLFYLLARVCKRVDMLNEFAFARCREVEAAPDGFLDLWAREHFKSSIITFALTIQDILRDPEITFGIFSHTRPIAKAFLRQIMRELEANKTLHAAFPDVLWGEDVRAAPKWSEDDGIIVKRQSNPNEATIEAWGLIDGQPTSKHFKVLLYDDVVVAGSVTTPEMLSKTMTEMERSYNLGTTPGVKRGAGTRWHFNDAYKTVVDRGTFVPREHPGREGGTEEGESVFWPDEIHQQKRRDMGPYTYAAQILLNPKADAEMGFRREWLRFYTKTPPHDSLNCYILVDSANTKRKESDYTAMWVVGLGRDGNLYALDIVRDRLNLTERVDRLFTLHRKYKPKQVRWERYGNMSDAEAVKREQENQNYRFDVMEVAGQTSKDDRIRRLIPYFENGKFYLPRTLHVTDWQKNIVDLVHSFVEEEFYPFPTCLHKDLLDSLSRIAEPDLKLVWPKEEKPQPAPPPTNIQQPATAWMIS
ncbi:MAG: phage terminase large subunit [Hyphomicrobiales bacterium]|nr:phage terminase large subunit [Hyphomicrobiales bacterium]